MLRDIKRLSKREYDLLVIGGGINGAAIAHLAAQAGLKVALLEKGDFGAGTSTKTTKLMHGGLRYLENFEFGLVREALHERTLHLKVVPYLVKPLKFIIPVYKREGRPLWMIRFGVWLYDLLCGKQIIQKHQKLTYQEVLDAAPGIKSEGLMGGVAYYDAQMDDARVCLENVLMAQSKGAHVANYVEVSSFIKKVGKVIGVRARDLVTNTPLDVMARKIVCAVGPWSNSILTLDNPHTKQKLRTTKGIHIVYRGQLASDALFIQTHKSSRIFFIIPWKGNSLIGTTDTDYLGQADHVKVGDADIKYLFEEASRIFPERKFQKEDIITTFAGLRPLVYEEGSPSEVSRKHVIHESFSGAFYVMGGKYTTYRRIAIDCLKKIYATRFNFEEDFTLYGSGELQDPMDELVREYETDTATVEYLKNIYGTHCLDVLKLAKEDPDLRRTLCRCSPAIAAQAVYAIQNEMAQKVEDVFSRRLGLSYADCPSKECLHNIEEIFAKFKKTLS